MLAGFMLFYAILFIVEMGRMLKYIRKGPFLDVVETAAWDVRQKHRLRTQDGNTSGISADGARSCQPDLSPALPLDCRTQA